MTNRHSEIVIVGGGIVGLATGLALTRLESGLRLTILEKEEQVAAHQTGHNSGVIHSGIYYKPGSLKARLCVEGARRMMEFCEQNGIKYKRIGKVIIATNESELPRLQMLHERAVANGVPGAQMIGSERIRELEPHAGGVCGIHSPNTAVVDYTEVSHSMRELLARRGASIETGAKVTSIEKASHDLQINTSKGQYSAKYLVNCAGLYSDMVARMMGLVPEVRILPFRGEYYFVKPERHSLVNGLIYPVPDPAFPFLGVHFTRTVHGEVEAGPNAVLAFAREGYTMGKINVSELASDFSFLGFWRMGRKYWRMGSYEYYRSFSLPAFVKALQNLIPDIREQDVVRGGAGVRAQAVTSKGELADDFIFQEAPRALHVLNAPSPAATASLAIGDVIAERALAAARSTSTARVAESARAS